MTIDEVIDFGKMWLEVHEDSKDSNTYEFVDIATKSLEQTRPKGKIIHKAPYGWGYCSECSGVVEPQDRFCSFCGARMERDTE